MSDERPFTVYGTFARECATVAELLTAVEDVASLDRAFQVQMNVYPKMDTPPIPIPPRRKAKR